MLAALILVSTWSAPVSADDWLVYLGGGLEPIEGGWEHRQGQVLFHKLGGTLVSIPFAELDLPTSAFVTWQLNGRREVPPRGPLPAPDSLDPTEDAPNAGAGKTCVEGRVIGLVDAETFRVQIGQNRETVHVACLDAPDTRHRFTELGWFGRVARTSAEAGLGKSAEVCLGEPARPQRDKQGHRIVYMTLASGRDYAAEVIAGGLGLLRLGPCERAGSYRRLEDRAIAEQRGLWGTRSEKAAFAVARNTIVAGAGATGAPPPRRVGGG